MLLYYIRHADPIYEPDSLTPLGERQAEALSRRLARFGLDELYSSDSERAQRTARPTAELLKKEVTLLPWANESLVWPETTLPGNSGNAFWLFGLPEHRRLLVSSQMQALGDRWYAHPAFAGTPVSGGRAMRSFARSATRMTARRTPTVPLHTTTGASPCSHIRGSASRF